MRTTERAPRVTSRVTGWTPYSRTSGLDEHIVLDTVVMPVRVKILLIHVMLEDVEAIFVPVELRQFQRTLHVDRVRLEDQPSVP